MWSVLTQAATGEPLLRTAMAAFVVFCFAWGFLRGVGRLMVFLAAVACGGAAAWSVLRYAPGPLIAWLNGFSPSAVSAASAIAGVCVFLAVRKFPGSLIRPAGPPASRARAGLISVFPALLVLWGGAVALRWAGSVARLHWIESAIDAGTSSRLQDVPAAVRLGSSATRGALGNLLDRVDPLHARDTAAISSLLVVRRKEESWRLLLRQPGVRPFFDLPPVRRLLRDHDVTRALSFSHYSALLTLPEVTAAAAQPAVRAAIRSLPVDELIEAALAGRIFSETPPRAEVLAD